MNRLAGLVLIVNTLMPLVIVMALAVVGNLIWSVVEDELSPPVNQLIANAEALKREAKKAAGTIRKVTEEVRDNAEKMGEKITRTTSAVSAVGNSVNRVITPITKFSVPYPKPPKLACKKAFAKITVPTCIDMDLAWHAPFKRMMQPFVRITHAIDQAVNFGPDIERSLQALQRLRPLANNFEQYREGFESQARELTKARDAVADAGRRIGNILWICLLVIAPWVGISYLLWARGRLREGWGLLRAG